jgi:tRNA threonylcarbamoyladenosine biosynthesis protein TsaB
MLVLTIRSDNPEAEVGLFNEHTQLAYETWHAHRELSTTIHQKIEALLQQQGKTLHDLQAVVCFQGPGSFTGLRIGLSVGNALAFGLDIPIVATLDDDWIAKGITRLHAGERDELALPHYGANANITLPRK